MRLIDFLWQSMYNSKRWFNWKIIRLSQKNLKKPNTEWWWFPHAAAFSGRWHRTFCRCGLRQKRNLRQWSVYPRACGISNYCKNNCFYCGIRRDNKNAQRYRLSEDEIISCCKEGYGLGFRTFVLQGGEDAFFTDGVMCGIISHIKEDFPDCAVGCGAYYCRRSCKGLVRNKK